MKKRVLLIFMPAFFYMLNVNAQPGASINMTGASADPSAMLDITSTNSGILIPRMTESQKNMISAPATGLLIYQTDGVPGFWYFNGTSWIQAIGPTGPTGNAGLLPSGTAAGNTPYWDGTQWVVTSSNIYNNGASVGIGTSSPAAAATLDLGGVSKGFLINRMTTSERNAIISPPDGLQIYNTTLKCFEFFADGSWRKGDCVFRCGADAVTFTYHGSSVNYGTVEGQDGTCWLNRNLGASQVATAYNDANAYGDLFQWGRCDDGHQLRSGGSSTSTLSSTDIPGHSKYITVSSYPNDWRSPQNSNLWQGLSGINNPCPSGWRLPSEIELNNERLGWYANNYNGAFASPQKFTTTGWRNLSYLINDAGAHGGYWSSTVYNEYARGLGFHSTDAYINTSNRGHGLAVRCILDY